MVSKPKLEILKKNYKITDKELISLGIIQPIPAIISVSLGKKENDLLTKTSYRLGVTKSDILRQCVDKIIEDNTNSTDILLNGSNYIDQKKTEKRNIVTFKISEQRKKELKKKSRKKMISTSKLIRCYLLYKLKIIKA